MDDEPYIDAHRSGYGVEIDMLYVPPHMRGRGIGTDLYENFERELPPDVQYVRVFAADTEGNGNSDDFWLSLGFEYRFVGSALDYMDAHTLYKGVNGFATPPTVDVDE